VSSPSPSLPSAICFRYHTFEIAESVKKIISAPISIFQKHAYPWYVFDFKILYLYKIMQAASLEFIKLDEENVTNTGQGEANQKNI